MAFDHFRLLAPIYDRVIQFDQRERLILQLDLPIRGRLLDAGGGTGRVAKEVETQAGEVVVADVSRGMLKQASAKKLQAVNTASEKLPFEAGTFERVLMVDAFHHVSDQRQTAQELWRMTADGGRILIIEPDIRKLAVKGIALFEKLALMRSHFLTPDEIMTLFQQAGARTRYMVEKSTAYVVIEKGIPSNGGEADSIR